MREIWCRQNKAIRVYIPGELTHKMAAEIFDYRNLQTKISLAEYDRWIDLINGSVVDLLSEFYVDMVKKYEKNYYHFALLIHLHDLNL